MSVVGETVADTVGEGTAGESRVSAGGGGRVESVLLAQGGGREIVETVRKGEV